VRKRGLVQEPTLTSQQPEKASRLPLILGVIGLFLILIMTAMLAFYPFHYKELNGDVRVEETRVYLTNNSDYDWTDVRLLLNTDYKLRTAAIPPHTEFSSDLSEFKKDDGTSFNSSYSLDDLYVTALTPEKQTISNIFKFNK
jgi:hypothetical protein